MSRLTVEDWCPIGIEDLEPNAWKALTHEGSGLVLAGPGAGKTEFLAQRAAYLLQTGKCPAPYRILAISFKRDAAENLARRVQMRCTPDEARRFVSVTFDSFTKGLVDRFFNALPEQWRPSRPYEVFLTSRRDIDAFLQATLAEAPPEWQPDVSGLRSSDFEPRGIGGSRLTSEMEPRSGAEFARHRWWRERMGATPSTLTFTCLNRLAEMAVRTSDQLRRALLTTYPCVFVDEFQDTTYAQYDFLASVFAESKTHVTAVGDDKQRIMTWAGARADVFEEFEGDFAATRFRLRLNHRSSPGLVQVQQVIARALDAESAEVESTAIAEIDGDVAEVWNFSGPEEEAAAVAAWIDGDMKSRGKGPRDYCILVRQRAADAERQLGPEFAEHSVSIRNESLAIGRTTLQDLLAEKATRLALDLLHLATAKRAPGSWASAMDSLLGLRAIDPDDAAAGRLQDELTHFVREMRGDLKAVPSRNQAEAIAERIFDYLDRDAFRRAQSEYGTGDNLDIAIEAFGLHLANSAAATSQWTDCIELFEGIRATPLMTVHKSKGLEYDTIVFMGLDDESWWSRQAGDSEGLSTFFVALSRAKQRAIFTYCRSRRRGRVADLYQLLADAGVPEVMH